MKLIITETEIREELKKKNKTKRRKLNNREVSERFNRNLG